MKEEFNLSDKIEEVYESSIGEAILFKSDVKEFIEKLKDLPLTAEQLAEEFHNTYESCAEMNGWQTQKICRTKFEDLPEKNKETMINTCQHIVLWIEAIMFNKRVR